MNSETAKAPTLLSRLIGQHELIPLKRTKKRTRPPLRNRVAMPRIATVPGATNPQIATAAFKSLRTKVVQGLAEHKCNSVMVTGATEGVGKSTVSINLAAAVARQGIPVLLVELDLRKPSIGKTFGLQQMPGIESAVNKNFNLKEAMTWIPELKFSVLACGGALSDSSEILTSSRVAEVFKTVETIYRDGIVIYDAPPTLGCDDVLAVSTSMKSALIVLEEGRTKHEEFQAARDTIGALPLLGVVLNKSRSRSFKHYYY